MFSSIVMLMLAQESPAKPTLQTGSVENGIIVLRPDAKYRGTIRVIPVDPKFRSRMPGAEIPKEEPFDLRAVIEKNIERLETLRAEPYSHHVKPDVDEMIRKYRAMLEKLDKN